MDTVRAWKDPVFRRSLGKEADSFPANPAGVVDLTEEDLAGVGGGSTVFCATLTITGGISVAFCSPNGTICGSCKWNTSGCC